MMKLFRKRDGAVMIFLIMILVPVLALTGIFVELSRIELSKSIMTSSADLALNTALTNYDYLLKDYYGLMGSAQETENTLDVAEQYFKSCLNSDNIDESQFDAWWNQLTSIGNNVSNIVTGEDIFHTNQEKISNLLKMDIPDGELSVSAVENANLSNPVFLQSQIVEFMKYRAPIEIASGLFKKLSTQAANLENLEKDSDLQYKEKTTYEAENALLQRLYDIYCEVEELQKLNINTEYIANMNEFLTGENPNSIKTLYANIHKNAVRRYINTDNYMDFRKKIFKIKQSELYENNTVYTADDAGTIIAGMTTSFGNTYPSLKVIEDFETARINLKEKFFEINDMSYQGSSITDSLQYTIQMYNHQGLPDLIDKYYKAAEILWSDYKNIYKIYQDAQNDSDLKNALKNASFSKDIYISAHSAVESALDAHTKEIPTMYDLLESINGYYENCVVYLLSENLYANPNPSNDYIEILAFMANTVFDVNIENEVYGTNDDNKMKELYTKLIAYAGDFEEARNILYTIQAMVDGTGKYAKEGSLKELSNLYSSNLTEWHETAKENKLSNTEGSFSKESKDRAEEMTKKSYISEEEINEFKSRIDAVTEYTLGVLKYIQEDTTYNEAKVYDIQDLGDFIAIDKNVVPAESINGNYTHQALKELAEKKFPFNYGTQQILAGNTAHPDIANISTPDLYTYMHEKFKDHATKKDDSKGQNIYDKYKDDKNADSKAEAEEEADQVKNILTWLQSAKDCDITEKAENISIFGSLITLASGLFHDSSGTLVKARDTLYVVEYCMGMFSYASYESEMKYDYMLKNDIVRHGTTASAQLEELSGRFAQAHMISDFANETNAKDIINNLIKSEDLTYTGNKSLTNKLIDSNNNYAYQREIEFILFGGDNAYNMRKTKTELFQLRYALNLIPGYKLFWGDAVVKSIAAAVSSATLGIVPEALVRVVMILLLVGLESWNDVKLLVEGVPVKLLKFGTDAKDAEWVYNTGSSIFSEDIGNLLSGVVTGEDDPVATNSIGDKTRFQYSEYLTLLLYFQLCDKNKSNNVYRRIGDVIQVNMAENITRNKDYRLKKAVTQFSLRYSVIVNPLILKLGIYNDYNSEALLNDKKWLTISGNMVRGY